MPSTATGASRRCCRRATIRRAPSTAAVRELAGDAPPEVLAHGTTVATNALLERTRRVRRAASRPRVRRRHRDRAAAPPVVVRPVRRPPRAARAARAALRGRRAARRRRRRARRVGRRRCPAFPTTVEAVAVCLLHSDRNPRPEQADRGARCARGGFDVTVSSELSPEFREYERMVTTVVERVPRPACGAVPRAHRRVRATRCS